MGGAGPTVGTGLGWGRGRGWGVGERVGYKVNELTTKKDMTKI